MAHFEGISILNENLTGNRLDANVGGKYLRKTISKTAKLASLLHKLRISGPLPDFRTSVVSCFTGISTNNNSWYGSRLEANVGGKYLKKMSPKRTKLAHFVTN